MLSELQELFLIAMIIATVESFVRMRKDAAAFVREPFGPTFVRSAARSALFWNDTEGFVFGAAFPLGWSFAAPPWPLSLSAEGVLAATTVTPEDRFPGSRTAVARRFEEITAIETVGRRIEINGGPFLLLHSSGHAKLIAAFLEKLRALPAVERGTAIDQALARSLDADAAKRRLDEVIKLTAPLRLLGTLFFLEFFGVLFAAAFFGMAVHLIVWLAPAVVLLTMIVVTFGRLHLALMPQRTWEMIAAAAALLIPFHAIRAGDVLLQKMMEYFHPLAVAAATLPADGLNAECAPWARAAIHPRTDRPAGGDLGAAIDREFRERFGAALRTFAAKSAIDFDSLARTIPEGDAASTAYCPRCGMTFARVAATCTDCTAAVVRYSA